MIRFTLITTMLFCGSAVAQDGSFYKNPRGLFSTRPSETKSLTTIKRFGPVGMGIDLIQPAFTMRISHIEEGSPAAETGVLKKGQIIETINGQKQAIWVTLRLYCEVQFLAWTANGRLRGASFGRLIDTDN